MNASRTVLSAEARSTRAYRTDTSTAISQESCRPEKYHVEAGGPNLMFRWRAEIVSQDGLDPGPINSVRSDAHQMETRRPKFVDLDCSKFLAIGLLELPTWRGAWCQKLVRETAGRVRWILRLRTPDTRLPMAGRILG